MHEVDQDVVVMYTLITIFLFKFFLKKTLDYFFVYYAHEDSESVCRVFTFEGVRHVTIIKEIALSPKLELGRATRSALNSATSFT